MGRGSHAAGRNSRAVLDAAADATAAWNDETRLSFDKQHVEPIGRKLGAHGEALAALAETVEALYRAIGELKNL